MQAFLVMMQQIQFVLQEFHNSSARVSGDDAGVSSNDATSSIRL